MQWPAMAVTVIASWMVASRQQQRRKQAFWVFLVSNVLWVAWGLHADAWGVIALQACLAALNVRGARRQDKGT